MDTGGPAQMKRSHTGGGQGGGPSPDPSPAITPGSMRSQTRLSRAFPPPPPLTYLVLQGGRTLCPALSRTDRTLGSVSVPGTSALKRPMGSLCRLRQDAEACEQV